MDIEHVDILAYHDKMLLLFPPPLLPYDITPFPPLTKKERIGQNLKIILTT